jgi:hypothetical protein
MATLSLDGHAVVSNWSSANNASVTLTTANANDLIVIAVTLEVVAGNTHAIVSGISKTGGTGTVGTFTRRSSLYVDNPGSIANEGGLSLEVWSASATTALTGAVFKVTANATIDDACISAFGVNYDSSNVPVWTSNVACPAQTSNTTSSSDSAVTVSGAATNNPAMVLGFFLCGNSITETQGTNFTLIDAAANGGASNACSIASEYRLFASSQSNATVAFGTNTHCWLLTGDAIENPAGGADTLQGSTPLLMI